MLLRKMLRELKQNRLQFISIFLISFLGIFIFGGMTAIGNGMDESAARFYKETNLADAVIYRQEVTAQDKKAFEVSSEAAARRLTLDCTAKDAKGASLELNVIDSLDVSAPYVMEGKLTAGVWLDSQFAEENGIRVGDTIRLDWQEEQMEGEVSALIMHPDYVYDVENENQVIPNHQTHGYAFMDEASFQKAAGQIPEFSGPVPYSQLLLKTGLSKEELLSMAEETEEQQPVQVVMRRDFTSYAMFADEIEQMQSVGSVFPLVFLLIAVLTTLTTMTRLTAGQRTQIGTLKALGIKNSRLYSHYMSYGIGIGIWSSALGAVLGPLLMPPFLYRFQQKFYSLPQWEGKSSKAVVAAAVLSVCCYAMIGFLTCRKEMKTGAVSDLLRPRPPKAGKHVRPEGSRIMKRLPFSMQWNLRDMARNQIRSLIMILGSLGCVMLVICALGMRDTVGNLADVMYGKLNRYETKVTFLDENRSMMSKQEDAAFEAGIPKDSLQMMQEEMLEMQTGSKTQTVSGTVQGDGSLIRYLDVDGKDVELPADGAAISEKLAKDWGLEKGDRLKLRIYGEKEYRSVKLAQIVDTPLGQGIFMRSDVWEKTGEEFRPTGYVTMEKADAFQPETYAGIVSKKDMIESYHSMMDMMESVIAVMIAAAILLGTVVSYNLGTLAFFEKYREMATLSVLGFSRKQLGRILIQQNLLLCVPGILLGIPAGYGLLSYMMRFMGDSMSLTPDMNESSYVLCTLGILLLTWLSGLLMAGKLRRLHMVSALKSVE